MTENDWHTCTDPAVMLAFLLKRTTPRKLRLFACASARQLWDYFRDERSRTGIEVSERFADGRAVEDEREQAENDADAAHIEAPWYATRQALAAAWAIASDIADGAFRIMDDVTRVFARQAALDTSLKAPRMVLASRDVAAKLRRLKHCDLMREVFGNPFRPVEIDPAWLAADNGVVSRIAGVIYEERTFEDMPILGDALEEVGCQNEEMLAHCRTSHGHVRGCWLLDALLGRE